MSSLPTQPYRVDDFSGGLTENFIGGGPTRYMAADNFWLTVDKKLEVRYGSGLIDSTNFQFPGSLSAVNALIDHDVQQYLLGISAPSLWVLNPNWTALLGPTGNPAMLGSQVNSQFSWCEWSHHTLITNDSWNTNPTKIYRGAAYPAYFTAPAVTPPNPAGISNFMAVTAGLPVPVGAQNINNSELLYACINLANSIRVNFIEHIEDFGATIGTQLHNNLDSIDLNLLNATPAATTQATLFTLITALISAYTNHISDVVYNFASPSFHWRETGTQQPLNFLLSNLTTPITLILAASILDELKTKFFMHEMAPYTHGSNNYAVLGRHLVTLPHIGTISTGPLINYSITQSLSAVNSTVAIYNNHISSTVEHMQADTIDLITFPAAVDLDTLYITIVLLNVQYTNHILDSAFTPLYPVTFTLGAGNTAVTLGYNEQSPNPTVFTPIPGQTVYDPTRSVYPQQGSPPTIGTIGGNWALGTGTGTGTMSRASLGASVSGTNKFYVTSAQYHIELNTNFSNETIGVSSAGVSVTYAPNNANLANWMSLLTQFITAFNAHDADSTVHIISGGNQNSVSLPTIASYAYAFHYFYQYMRYDGVIFQVVGTPTLVGPIQTEAIAQSYTGPVGTNGLITSVPTTTLSISNIPYLTNGTSTNYDTANVQIKIFRTINAGSTYYNCGIIANNVTQFTDTLPDTSNIYLPSVVPLNNQTVIYTSGGVVNYDQAPVAKYVTILQNTAYYGGIIDTGQNFPNRIRQSIQNNIDSSPGSFFLDLPDMITGLSNTRNNVVAFCANSTYQVTGVFNQLGQGQMQYQSISDTIGCVSAESVVRTDVGIFFAGTDGFYYTDGFQLIKLSSELNLTYAALTSTSAQQKAIYGCYDRYNRRVWWSTQPNPSDWSATQSYIFHVNFGVTANGVFTTASNYNNYRPSSMIFFQGRQLRGDARGYIFQHTIQYKTDLLVNPAIAPSLWNTVGIPYNYSSCAVDFGTTFNRKWVTRISTQGKNVGNIGAQIMSVSDNGRVLPLNLSPIWFNKNIIWGKPSLIWGAPNASQPITWGDVTEMDAWRRMPATQLRADFKQIKITPANIGVYRSEDWPIGCSAVLVPQGLGVCWARIITPPGYTHIQWYADVVGYNFTQQSDAYVGQYPITAITTTTLANDTLVLQDTNNTLTASTVAWVIQGILKQQRLSMTSYNIHFTLLGKNQHAYQGSSDSGANT